MSRRVPKSICRAARVVLIVFETGGGADAGAALGVFLPNGFGDDSFDCVSLSKAEAEKYFSDFCAAASRIQKGK